MKPRGLITIAVISAFVPGCAFHPPVGVWESDTPEGYIGYDFRPEGRCLWIGVEKKAGVGLGSWCSYSYDAETGIITIAEFWDNSGERFKPEKPLLLKYDQTSRTVIWNNEGKTVVLEWTFTLGYQGWH